MSALEAAEKLAKASEEPGQVTTHDLANALLALPAQPLVRLDQQGGPESWSPSLHDEVEVQVGVRSW